MIIKKHIKILSTAIFIYTAGCFLSHTSALAENSPMGSVSVNKPAETQPLQQTNPFNNMVRKFLLLAGEVVTDKPATDPANSTNTKTDSTSTTANTTPTTAQQNAAKSADNKTSDNKPADTKTTASKPVPSSPDAKELDLPELKDPEDPSKSAAGEKLSTKSITQPDNSNSQEGVVSKFFNNLGKQNNHNGSNANMFDSSKPLSKDPILDLKIKRLLAKRKAEREAKIAPVIIDEKPSEPSPAQRPDNNYRTQELSDTVSKKSYDKENQHLPYAVYSDEYKKILFDSAALGNMDILRAMVDNFKDTEITDDEGNTPLIYASMAGNMQSVVTLFSMGANINARNINGVSALYAATKLGRLDIVQFLLSRQADPDITDTNDKTSLMLSSEMDFSRIAELLLERGVNPDRKMKNGNTAVHFAAQNNSTASLNLLITKGADLDIRNFKGYTPLMLAVENNQDKTTALLLSAGADITKVTAQGNSISTMTSNTAILNLIESEKIRRKLLAQELINTRKTQVSDISPNSNPDDIVAQRIGGIPIPVIKPGSQISSSVPKPLFSKEEMQQMQNPGL